MDIFVVVENPKAWSLALPGAEVVAAQDYLINPRYADAKRSKVFNLCRTYGYQTVGYYVSLLATARGHSPMPAVSTIQDLRQTPIVRIVADEIDEEVHRALRGVKTETFELSIYFGRNVAKRYDSLARLLFNQFPAPFLRAEFCHQDSRWRLENLRPIAADDIPESHQEFVRAQAARHFARPQAQARGNHYRYDIAILVNQAEPNRPSNDRAIARFCKAAKHVGLRPFLIDRDDYGRIAEYDALFIRETTSVNHHTYRFSRRAAAEGLVVIDDPESIVRCTNKVYLAEMFARHQIPCPKTFVVHEENAEQIATQITFPCVVKRPDSSFSLGVHKANSREELESLVAAALDESELAIVQEFVTSAFDWRVGVLAGRALYACRYHYAKGDWRIQIALTNGKRDFGRADTIPIIAAPPMVVELALAATRPIGDGFYGVDIKESGGRYVVMEVNDNPSVDAGIEDEVLKDELYESVMRAFLMRLEARGRRN